MSPMCITQSRGYRNDMLHPRAQIHGAAAMETSWFTSAYISTEKDPDTQQLLIKPLVLGIMTSRGKRGTGA